ncbi:Retrovirus-related Pol polyprotein from transposon 17.6 [Thelohanellus kitauei]|uniref:Pro-Pol polyprotein n=1 Tax=Thelohanellus kitauei TaxID=669202 RepID=A0A0C2N0Z5_THEKT|nr:Retrovirus-related Pol polyprotein from transposon 17.6 [Thelohanellus kitauei]
MLINNRTFKWNFTVTKRMNFDILIGRDFLSANNMVVDLNNDNIILEAQAINAISNHTDKINPELPMNQKKDLSKLLTKYNDCFSIKEGDIGFTDLHPHKIETLGAKPVVCRPYRVPPHLKEEISNQIDNMITRNIIRKSSSPWCSPVLLVKKKDGTHRFCTDFRQLNKVIVKDQYSLPNMDDMLDNLANSQYFTTLDLKSGYWQCALDEDSKPKTAFCPFPGAGLYEYNVLPFGLSNAPSTFQRLMDQILSEIADCDAYLDDIIIFSNSFEEHLKTLKSVLDRLKSAGLKLKLEKCKFAHSRLEYLGYLVTPEGIEAKNESIRAILEWETPKNQSDIRSFLGCCNYYHRFIKNMALIAGPLNQLLRKDSDWVWTRDCENAFADLKTALSDIPIVRRPDFTQLFILHCDALNKAVGAVLYQIRDNKLVPIAFASNTLNSSQRKYGTVDKECWATVWATRKFRHYLYGQRFQLYTDHNPLIYLKSMADPRGRRSRWITELEELDFEIHHIPGKLNTVADSLSRSINTVELGTEFNIQAEQEKSKEISEVIMILQNKRNSDEAIENYSKQLIRGRCNLFIHNGILWQTSRRGSQVVIPKEHINEVIKIAHENSLSHLGVNKTLILIINTSNWSNMYEDVTNYVKACMKCTTFKSKNYKPIAELNPFPQLQRFELWEVDYTGQLPTTSKGNRYIIVFIDHCTKWVEAKAVEDQSAITAAKAFFSLVVSRFGVQKYLLSDMGTAYESELFQQVCEYLGCAKLHTTPYHPMGNGLVERSNKTILRWEKQKYWLLALLPCKLLRTQTTFAPNYIL